MFNDSEQAVTEMQGGPTAAKPAVMNASLNHQQLKTNRIHSNSEIQMKLR